MTKHMGVWVAWYLQRMLAPSTSGWNVLCTMQYVICNFYSVLCNMIFHDSGIFAIGADSRSIQNLSASIDAIRKSTTRKTKHMSHHQRQILDMFRDKPSEVCKRTDFIFQGPILTRRAQSLRFTWMQEDQRTFLIALTRYVSLDSGLCDAMFVWLGI